MTSWSPDPARRGRSPLTVAICSHNPIPSQFDRVIAGLRAQDLDRDCWDLLVVDNCSRVPIASMLDLSWHPSARIVREDSLGLVSARLRSIGESSGDLLVFVDDDNVLAPDYLSAAVALGRAWPILGAWGGQLIPEFDRAPEPELEDHVRSIGIRRFSGERWSNLADCWDTVPYGAGMCVRRIVADRWVDLVRASPLRRSLGVHGDDLMRCEDIDLAFTAADLGLGTGLFDRLVLTHLVPERRVQPEYLLRLVEGNAYSRQLLAELRGATPPGRLGEARRRLSRFVARLGADPVDRGFARAEDRGRQRALGVASGRAPGPPASSGPPGRGGGARLGEGAVGAEARGSRRGR